MNWSKLPFRQEDPCDQATEFFDRIIPEGELQDALNALSRQGFNEIFYDVVEKEVDPTYQERTYAVTAHRIVCACQRKIEYLKVE